MSFIILLVILIGLSIQDIKEHKIYDIIPLAGIIIGISLGFFYNDTIISACYTMLFGLFILLIPYLLIRFFKKQEGIGFGDVLVSACIGTFLSFNETYLSITIGFLSAFIFCYLTKKTKIALVPFFTFGVILTKILGVFYEINMFNFA